MSHANSFTNELMKTIEENLLEIELSFFEDELPTEHRQLSSRDLAKLEKKSHKVDLFLASREFNKALKTQESIFNTLERLLGPLALETLESLKKLSELHFMHGDLEKAKTFYRRAFRGSTIVHGERNFFTQTLAEGFAKCSQILKASETTDTSISYKQSKQTATNGKRTGIREQIQAVRATRSRLLNKEIQEIRALMNSNQHEQAAFCLSKLSTSLIGSNEQIGRDYLAEVIEMWIESLRKIGLHDSAEKTRVLAKKFALA